MKQLDEKLLAGDFTFGFELEAYLKNSLLDEIPIKKDELFDKFVEDAVFELGLVDLYNSDEYINNKIETYWDYLEFKAENSYGDEFDNLIEDGEIFKKAEEKLNITKYFPDDAKWIKSKSKGFAFDGSLAAGSFEWRSPVMVFTPEAIAHSISFLKNVKKFCDIERDCGFHTHISFNDISEDDAKWIMIKLALDKDMTKKIQELHALSDRNKDKADRKHDPIEFFSSWAKTDYLYDIAAALKKNNLKEVNQLLNTTKYRALRIHPQGTLEWRSPRDFLNQDYSDEYIKSFFLLLYDFISWMRNALDSTTAGDYSKDNLLNLLNSYNSEYGLFDKNVERKITSLRNMFLKVIDNPMMVYKLDKMTISQLAPGFVHLAVEERNSICKSIVSLLQNGKKVPNKILAIALAYVENDYIKDLCSSINQPMPIKELKAMSKYVYNSPLMAKMVQCFRYMTKDECLDIIENIPVSFDALSAGFSLCYRNTKEIYLPDWLNNKIYQLYGETIKKEDIIKKFQG